MLKNKIITPYLPLLLFILTSCKGDILDDTNYTISDELNTVEVLENYEQFSTYLDILELTGYYTYFQNEGNYTCFAPTNIAIEEYMSTKWGVSSIDELTEEQKEFLETLVKFHTVPRKLFTENFTEGSLKDTTLTGDYLISSYLDNEEISNIVLNKNTFLGVSDIETSNGIIHELHGMLDPYTNTIPEKMELEGEHVIFVEAMKQTGFYNTFSELTDDLGNKKLYTLFAESDEVYSNYGINSFDDLVNEVSPNNNDYTAIDNELNRYIAYHATLNSKYLVDLQDEKSLTTMLLNNPIIVTLKDNGIRLNEDVTANEEDELWTELIIEASNYGVKNGVYHTVNKLLKSSVLKPRHILFDFISDQPEYKDSRINRFYSESFWSGIYWSPDIPNRYLQQPTRVNLNNNVLDYYGPAFIEFTTPVIPVGKYELLISGFTGNRSRAVFQIYWDGEPIGSIYDMTTHGDNIGFPNEDIMEENGWRIGLDFIENNQGIKASEDPTQMRFIISDNLVCSTQTTHILRLATFKAGTSHLDYIEFIPVTE